MASTTCQGPMDLIGTQPTHSSVACCPTAGVKYLAAQLSRSALQLGRDDGELEQLAGAEGADRDRVADPVADHQALQVAGVLHRHPVHVDDQVLVAQAGAGGGAALDDLDDLDPGGAVERGGDPWRQRPVAAGDADEGAAEATLPHQRGDDLPGGVVDRYGEPEADPGHGGAHPDHAAAPVDQRATRVAWVERRVGLDDVLDQPAGAAVAGREGAAEP